MRQILHKNTLIVAEMKDGTAKFVRSFTIGPKPDNFFVMTTGKEAEANAFESDFAESSITALHNAMEVSGTTESQPIQHFRSIGVRRAWKATYKPHAKSRKPKTIGAFFARTHEAATKYAVSVVERETFEDGVLIGVEETDDPRK